MVHFAQFEWYKEHCDISNFSSISYTIMPVYIAELTPKEFRGVLVSSVGPAYLGGYLLALCVNVGFAKFPLGWRVTMAATTLAGLAYAIGLLFVPHSPR